MIKLLIGNIYQFLEMQKDYGEKTITLNALESCSYGFLRHTEESYMLTCKIVPRETYDTFGILFKV